MKRLLTVVGILTAAFASSLSAWADGFSTTPMPLTENSKDVVLHFNALQSGNETIAKYTEANELYAHIGVYTTKSPDTWAHVKTDWPTASNRDKANTEANRFVYQGDGQWTLSLGDLRTYFGITDPNESITTICVLARNAAGTTQTSDNFIEVKEDVFSVAISNDGPTIITEAQSVNIKFGSTREANLTIKVNGNVIATGKGTSLTTDYEVKQKGTYHVEGIAEYNGQTQIATDEIIFAGEPVAMNYPGGVPRMGAVRNSDGTVTFCIAAPDKERCYLLGAWHDYRPDAQSVMNYQDYQGNRYFWTTVSGLDDHTYYPYYYQIDGKTNVGDPYAHLILDPYNDKYIKEAVFPGMPKYPSSLSNIMLGVYRGDIDDYDWQYDSEFTIPDHYTLNIYELLVRDFTGANKTADGTIREAAKKIPYLADLGINAIELMPIMEFNGNNSWGYNTNFYMAPDKAYGTPDDYKYFIDECHKHGIAVILDIVLNQSDGLHPWYQMYPIASNPFYNKTAPHKWSVLNDWNQSHPLVQQQWKDALRYWLEAYHVDGFRFDLVKGLAYNEHYTKGGANTDSYIAGRVEVMKQINEYVTSVKPDAIHINELLGDGREDNDNYLNGGQMGWMQANNQACQYAMGYGTDAGCNLGGFYESRWNRTKGATVSYAESHDEQRMAFKQKKWGHASVKGNTAVAMKRLGSVAAQMWMAPGAHMMWMFGEVGADENTKDSKFENNDTSPKPVYWSYFKDEDRKALFDTYRALLICRKDNPELFTPETEVAYTGFINPLTARSIRLTAGDKELVVLLNPGVSNAADVKSAVTKLNADNVVLLTASPDYNGTPSFADGSIVANIPAHSFAIYVSKAVTGVENVGDDIIANTAYAVGGNGTIEIHGEYTHAAVYDLTGRQTRMDNLTPGTYIVDIDGTATKVLVK